MNEDIINALTDKGDDQGFLKAGFLGFAKSGKSYTSALLAVATRRHFDECGPIAMFDTEGGSIYLRPTVEQLTGAKLLAKRARSFDDLMAWGRACVEHRVSVAIVDSITHPWRELCDSYLAQLNEKRASGKYRNRPQTKLEFQDWGTLKSRWALWTDFYLNSPLHIIIAGRAGYEYDMEERDDGSGKKDLIKTGIKMKTEGEFGFEPSLLVSMEREQFLGDRRTILRTATVLGDRFGVIDGKTASFPSTDDRETALAAIYQFFRPHLECLTSGAHATVNTSSQTDFGLNTDGDDDWQAERRQRVILCEELQGEILRLYPGQTAAEKKAKADLLSETFETRSWTKVEGLNSRLLRQGLESIRAREEHVREPGEEG